MTPNPKPGDALPIVGGPLDGQTKTIGEPLFPWSPNFLPAGFTHDGHRYEREGAQWVYKGKWPQPKGSER